MESPRKTNDCYFYYYSTCTKGDTCTFRHEPSALGCETVCSFWKESKCLNVRCSYRHMELRKNRKAIPCYWEAQPGGCLKAHCPFLHKNKDGTTEDFDSTELQPSDLSKALGQSSSQVLDNDRKVNQYSDGNFGNPTVDPLVVNFEEESDNESAPTNSPSKSVQTRVVKVKTLEEIRLEKIQAESAAYYFYPGVEETILQGSESETADDLRRRIMQRLNIQVEAHAQDYEVLSLDEIRKRKKRSINFDGNSSEDDDLHIKENIKKRKLVLNKKHLNDIKVKTLAEIRAEKLLRTSRDEVAPDEHKRKREDEIEVPTTCSEVSSTSNLEEMNVPPGEEGEVKPAKRQRRKVSSSTDQMETMSNKPKLKRVKFSQEMVESSMDSAIETQDSIDTKNTDDSNKEHTHLEETVLLENEERRAIGNDIILFEQSHCDRNDVMKGLQQDSSKIDDILLLDDEDIEESSINLKEEEDILKDIDDLLND